MKLVHSHNCLAFIKINRWYIVGYLLILLCFTILLRPWDLSHYTKGFFADEASNGYDAYSIATSGVDQHGESWPLFFRQFDNYVSPVFIYSSVPIIKLFGLSEQTIRFSAFLYGIGTILALGLFLSIAANKQLGLLASSLLALTPWHIHLSSIALEPIAANFWLLIALSMFFLTLKKVVYLPIFYASMFLYLLTYSTSKIYAPLIVLILIVVYFRELVPLRKTKYFWVVSILCALVVGFTLYPSIHDGTFFARYKQLNVSGLSLYKIESEYMDHFSLTFLFDKGDAGFPGQFVSRHSIIGLGELLWFQAPLIPLGLYYLLSDSEHRKLGMLILGVLMIYPLGSVLAGGTPQATRSVIGVVGFSVLAAAGLYLLLDELGKVHRIIALNVGLILSIILLLSVVKLTHAMLDYASKSADYWGWQYGAEEILDYFFANQDEYDEMYMTGAFNGAHIFLNFYDPLHECVNCFIANPAHLDLEKRQLFALRPEEMSQFTGVLGTDVSFQLIEPLYYPDNSIAFYIGVFHQR